MKNRNKTLEFNEEKSLYKIVHGYFAQNDIELYGKKHDEISRKLIRNLIFNKGAIVNSFETRNATYKIENGDLVQIPSIGIEFHCIENKKLQTQSNHQLKTTEADAD